MIRYSSCTKPTFISCVLALLLHAHYPAVSFAQDSIIFSDTNGSVLNIFQPNQTATPLSISTADRYVRDISVEDCTAAYSFGNAVGMYKTDIANDITTVLRASQHYPTALALLSLTQIVWANSGSIYQGRSTTDSSADTSVFTGFTTIHSLAIDSDDGTIFSLEAPSTSSSGTIRSRSSLLASPSTIRAGVTGRDIELDPVNNKIYWSENSSPVSIMRANLDGSSPETIISSGLRYVSRLAIDQENSKLIWSDTGTGKIQRSNLNGTSVEDLITDIVYPKAVGVMHASVTECLAFTPTPTPTPTYTSSPTATATQTPTPAPTNTPTFTPTPTFTATATATDTSTPAPTSTATTAPSATPTNSPTAEPTATPQPTATDEPAPTVVPTSSVPPTPTPVPVPETRVEAKETAIDLREVLGDISGAPKSSSRREAQQACKEFVAAIRGGLSGEDFTPRQRLKFKAFRESTNALYRASKGDVRNARGQAIKALNQFIKSLSVK